MSADKPVLYLDLDDTLISWATGRPNAAPGAHDFVLWALERFEVRWLTTWCPSGEMEESLFLDLCKLLRMHPDHLRHIRGADWEETESKLNGILWLEHVALERPFVWLEDDKGVGERELRFLEEHGFRDRYRHVNVTDDPEAISRAHEALRAWLDEEDARAA